MSGTTGNRSYPYPQLTDTVDVPGDIQALADALDTDVQDILDNYLKGESSPITSNTATWTSSESGALVSVTFNLVSGITYAISSFLAVNGGAGDVDFMRIREDTSSGNQIQGQNLFIGSVAGSGYPSIMYVEYTAVSTASKTFVLTGNRLVGSTAHQGQVATNRPGYLTITPLLR